MSGEERSTEEELAQARVGIENEMDVCNVSMGTTKKGFFAALHNLADRAYFRNTVLVTAANIPHADG